MMQITVSTFNIRNFGTGGDYTSKLGSEHRFETVGQMISENLIDCDVMIFQEIFDVKLFTKLIPSNYKFQTYEAEDKRHQHIVVCYKNDFIFEDALNSGFILNGSSLGYSSSRPALYGRLCSQDGKPLAHIVGVHLKSGSEHCRNRALQAEVITNYFKMFKPKLPVVVTGDFNTQTRFSTFKEQDDVTDLSDIFSEVGLVKLKNPLKTFRTSWESHDLDHFWVCSKSILSDETWVYDPTTYLKLGDDKKSLNAYYTEVSDHVPVKTTIKLY